MLAGLSLREQCSRVQLAAHFAQGQQKYSTLDGVGMGMTVQPRASSGEAPVQVITMSEALHGSSQLDGPQI
jgi:hypothetical protein